MSADPLTAIDPRAGTPQNERARPDQVQNNAKGYVFSIGDDTRVLRFLVLGTTGGTYYVGERKLTRDNAEVIFAAARERGTWLVDQILAVSTEARAPRQNPGLFALAAVTAFGDVAARQAAFAALPTVARTASTLFTFIKYAEQFRGWGKGLQRAIAAWYLGNTTDWLAYQMIKYRQRDGWTHRDVLRSAHVLAPRRGTTDDPARLSLFDWTAHGIAEGVNPDATALPPIVGSFLRVQGSSDVGVWVDEIGTHRLPWEALPDAARTKPEVWAALVRQGMPITALLRNLPTLTRYGVLDDPAMVALVKARLTDPAVLRKGRLHPLNILIAMKVYASGHSVKGDTQWSPKRVITDALDTAFYASLHTMEAANKRTLVALDVSGSMGAALMDPGSFRQTGRHTVNNLPLTVREASVAMAMAVLASEPAADVVGFTGNGSHYFGDYGNQDTKSITELDLTPRRRLDDNVAHVANLPFGVTDCALPMLWAIEQKRLYDTMIIFTDSETWSGKVQPYQAMVRYRQRFVGDARLIVMGMTATDFSIADPTDPLMLDIVGLDAAAPNLIADFSAGRI